MEFDESRVSSGVFRRVYKAENEESARQFANLWSGEAYEYFPDDWRVKI